MPQETNIKTDLQSQPTPLPPPQREFLNIETAENSRINKGTDENIYVIKHPKKEG